MKKRITIDELAICFVAAVAYGFGFLIPEHYGCPFILSFIICFIPGLLVEELAEHIIFSRFIQEHHYRRVFAWLICIVIFMVGSSVAVAMLGTNLNEDLEEEFLWAFGIPILSFIISYISFHIKKRRIIKKYGDGSKGYFLSKEEKGYMFSLNAQNKPITGPYDEKFAVKTETGTFIGNREKDVIAYLGIPYAEPPVGERRWKKPVPLSPSEGVFEAKYYGASALQPENEANPLNFHRQSEDCLYLNIWKIKNSKSDAKYPVMVYLHDGDFLSGGSADPVGEGECFVKDNPETVFVSLNYRLGLFGFIDFSQVEGGEAFSDAINCGLLDQIEALKWIKKNIYAFGGDPDNITLMGAGSGAASALLLSTIQSVRDCFRKVIVMSAATEYVFDDPTSSAELGQALAEEFGAASMGELSAVPAEQLRAVMIKYANIGGAPSYKTTLLPEDILACWTKDAVREDLELIIGLPKDEISNTIAVIGKKAARERLVQWFDELNADPEWQAVLERYAINRPEDQKSEEELYQKGSALAYIDVPLYFGRILSEHGHSVRFFFWEITPNVDKFSSNATSFLTTVLHNFEIGEVFGYINDQNLKDILQLLFNKFLANEDVMLYQNEIIGIDALDWPLYSKAHPAVLRVNQKDIKTDNFFRESEINAVDES